ncbi:hypothetical protein A1353_09395 [Methylomonas methanica]|jgi:tetratricopeptide (TPR) repeat protein|uniref:Uncharacterized protein n=1 Tax=Methylomonas methanica TaxID=421 RepID=A0A177MKV4_METMH|nr:hypothetical protein [Methylomonas methanica]OAI06428.1 hypothetical protein A1353_09395 [Methylomonas methanica]
MRQFSDLSRVFLPVKSTWLILFVLFGLIASVYLPGRAGPFLADDYPNILDNNGVLLKDLSANELASAWAANTSGLFKRPLASLSFALNYYFAGQQFDRAAFKLTNISIHIVNSFLVFFLSRLLFRIATPNFPAQKLAFFTALIWALHPLQLTSVLYVVQRMASLSTLFMLSGLLVFLKGRLQVEQPFGIVLMVVGCVSGTLMGLLAKENALLLPILIFVCELTLLPSTSPNTRVRVGIYYSITVLLPVLLGAGYLLVHPNYVLDGYLSRDFSLPERLMTEARVVFYYLRLLFCPENAELGLFHDDFLLSKGFFEPKSTALAVIALVALLGVVIKNIYKKKWLFFNFAVLWFLIGQSMESSIFALELIYEHRNYLPSIGIVIAVVAFVYELLSKKISNGLLNSLFTCLVISLAVATYMRASIWSKLDSFSYFEARNHPLSARANSMYANSFELKNGPNELSYKHYLLASQLDTYEVSTLIEVYLELNRLIYFHDPNKDRVDAVMPLRYDDPLVLDGNYMKALKALVSQEINRRISARSHPLRTLVSMRTVTNCLINGDYECQTIGPDLISWIDTALTQSTFFDVAMMHMIKAKIYFNQGNTAEAMASVNKALELSPNRMYFYAEKASLLIKLNAYQEAEQTLKEAESRQVANGFDLKEFQSLRDLMADSHEQITH